MLFAGLLSFTILYYALAIAAVVLFYIYYTKPDDCTEHKVFISLNLIFCIIISVVSILPKVQVGVCAILGSFPAVVSSIICLTAVIISDPAVGNIDRQEGK